VLGLAALHAPVAAATYRVDACSPGADGNNRSWLEHRSAPTDHLTGFSECSTQVPNPSGDLRHGLGVVDSLGGGVSIPSDGRFVEQRLTAPGGTRLLHASVARDFGNRDVYWQIYGRVDAGDQPSETCLKPAFAAYCRVSGTIEIAANGAKEIAYGVRCRTAYGSCDAGATLHMVWAIVRSATVTLEDTEAPVVSAPRGDLADGKWRRGAGSLTFLASDNTGVRIRRLMEGSRVRASRVAPGAPVGCGDHNVGDAYTYLQPCAGSRGLNGEQSVSVSNVCAWGDGVHEVRGLAVDTGGGEALSDAAATVKVDCTAPVVSVKPDAVSEVDAGEAVAPAVTAVDAHAGVAATDVEVDAGEGVWRPYDAPVQAAVGLAYRFRARATDAAGNVSPWSEPSEPIFVRARPAPVEDPPQYPETPGSVAPREPTSPASSEGGKLPVRDVSLTPADPDHRHAADRPEPPCDAAPATATQADRRSPTGGRTEAQGRRYDGQRQSGFDRAPHGPRRAGATQGHEAGGHRPRRLRHNAPAASTRRGGDPRPRAAADARRTRRHGGEDRTLTSGDARTARSPLPRQARAAIIRGWLWCRSS
jgi:hypothetical protein